MNSDTLTTLGCCASIISLVIYLDDRLDQRIEEKLGPLVSDLQAITQQMSDEVTKLGIDRAQESGIEDLATIFAEDPIEALLMSAGYGAYHEESGTLPNGSTASFQLDLEAKFEYQFIGVCQTGCTDLDLFLYRPGSEDILVQDILPDDVPIIEHTPAESGEFSIEVEMYACEPDFCQWTVQVRRRSLA